MKTSEEIQTVRRRVIQSVDGVARATDLPTRFTSLEPRDVYFMLLGALAMADDALQLDRPDNLGRLLAGADMVNWRNVSAAGSAFDKIHDTEGTLSRGTRELDGSGQSSASP